MDVSASSAASLGSASAQQSAALAMLKQSIDQQGQLALQLLPQAPPRPDPTSALGQNIDVRV